MNEYVKFYDRGGRHWAKVDEIKENFVIGTIISDNKGRKVKIDCSCVKGYWEGNLNGLGAPYIPAADACVILDTITPDSMDYEVHIAIRKVKIAVGGDITKYVREKLKYSEEQLCNAFAAEQVDALALAIYNIEEKHQGIIIGDQAGIGKGRIAAGMIVYGCSIGKQPIFLSEKVSLFTDIYRDLVDIGAAHLVPFIINEQSSDTDMKDSEGNVVYRSLPPAEQKQIFESQKLPKRFDYVVATYSQFNSSEKRPLKPMFFSEISHDNILILDEAHNAGGKGNTGLFMQNILAGCRGVTFLSATFAKRPDNMPVYAMKTCISECNLSKEDLVFAIESGGVALQEVLASQLVAEGQMIRRERSFDGVEVNYIILDDYENEHKAASDSITGIIRDIISFQENYIKNKVDDMDTAVRAAGETTEARKGTEKAGVDNQPYFSKVFNTINQMLFSIKAEAVANRAIERLKEGKKPVIAFSSTMESYFNELRNEYGQPVQEGDYVSADFKEVLLKGLQSVMRYTVRSANGQPEYKEFQLFDLGLEAEQEYNRILKKISEVSTGISISPIDVIISKITGAGFSIAEVTGRKQQLQFKDSCYTKGLITKRKKLTAQDAFRQFQNNETDVLLINQSGSTGKSAHAIVTNKVPLNEVKQRVMIVLQAELNVSTEVQKRGRVNRTGQVLKPIYDYMNSAIPAEKRLMMMLQRKLKSLDANTTSNQKQSTKILDTADFLNKYGDRIVTEYLLENKELNKALGDPLDLDGDNKSGNVIEDIAYKASGRVAVLSTEEQAKFYNEIMERYNDYIIYMQQTGEYDLEVEAMNLEAETLEAKSSIIGKGGHSSFGNDSILELCEVNNLRKPYSKEQIQTLITQAMSGRTNEEIKSEILALHQENTDKMLLLRIDELNKKYDRLINDIPKEKKYEKAGDKELYVKERTNELKDSLEKSIHDERQTSAYRFEYLRRFFKTFSIGMGLNFPVLAAQDSVVQSKAIFLGFVIDLKRDNPFAPSAVKMKFAISDSRKYILLSASGDQGKLVNEVIGLSSGMTQSGSDEVLTLWDKHTKESSSDRGKRYIVTGNLLQAYSNYKGKLVNFTVKGGGIRKGILMPEAWKTNTRGAEMVSVPINNSAALRIIKGLSNGAAIWTNNEIALFKSWGRFKIIVPKSKPYKPIFEDTDIRALLDNQRDGFEYISGKMQGFINEESIDELAEILANRYSLSVKISPNVIDTLIDISQEKQAKPEDIALAEQMFKADKEKFEKRTKPGTAQIIPEPMPVLNVDKAAFSTIKLKLKMASAKLQLLAI